MSSEIYSECKSTIIIMMIFNMSTSYLHKISFSLVWGLFNDEIDIRVTYLILNKCFKLFNYIHIQ